MSSGNSSVVLRHTRGVVVGRVGKQLVWIYLECGRTREVRLPPSLARRLDFGQRVDVAVSPDGGISGVRPRPASSERTRSAADPGA